MCNNKWIAMAAGDERRSEDNDTFKQDLLCCKEAVAVASPPQAEGTSYSVSEMVLLAPIEPPFRLEGSEEFYPGELPH